MDDRIKTIADHYGYEAQSRQLIEEMAELTQALNKEWRCANGYLTDESYDVLVNIIAEEAADVEIMLEQLKYLMHVADCVADAKDGKLKRQLERIKGEESARVITGVHGIHKNKAYKQYHWRVPEGIEIKEGDIAIVDAKGKLENVVVTGVFEWRWNEAKHLKPVYDVLRFGGSDGQSKQR